MQEAVLTNLKELCSVLEQRSGHFITSRKFRIELGRKNYKVVAEDISKDGKVIARSVHCFVDMANGNVYKAASWSSAAKGIRYNLLTQESRELALKNADPYGGYLYRVG